jgi:outer membrane murein-binding lipoprotein Lpp
MVTIALAALLLAGCGAKPADESATIAEQEKQLAELKAKVAEAEQKLAETRASTPAKPARREPAPQPPARRALTIPAGTPIAVRTTTEISTDTARAGEPFDASLEEPLVVQGTVVAPRGARVIGTVASADKGGRVKGRASLSVRVRSIVTADGRILDVRTDTMSLTAEGSKKEDALKVGIATGVGAAIGAIAGGGQGAAIGAGAGAGAGAGTVLLTRGNAAVLPAESVLRFKLADPVSVAP